MLSYLLAGLLALQPVAASEESSRMVTTPPAPEQVLAIPDELREEFAQKVLRTKFPEQRLYRLVDFMLKPEGLGLTYQPDATNTVEESYRTRQVNCMAFTMMAVALARGAGLTAYPQQIDKIMAWDLSGDVITQSLHANAVVIIGVRKYMLDIAVGNLSQPVVDYRIDDAHLLALFYGNRAMSLLVAGKLQDADRWQSEALRLDQMDATLLNNAGVVRQRLRDTASAERFYLKAVALNPRLNSAIANLVALYRERGDIRQANAWQQQGDRVLRRDPYYQYAQGRREEEAGDYANAIKFYRRAISLHGDEHVFHFSLARAYLKSGNLQDADDELVAAQRLSVGATSSLYAAKRVALQRLRH